MEPLRLLLMISLVAFGAWAQSVASEHLRTSKKDQPSASNCVDEDLTRVNMNRSEIACGDEQVKK